MPEELINLDELIQPDGFINYYAVLSATTDTPTEQLQESINTLYQEAQVNRDHRISAKRRDYQTLLEILPQARLILLDEARRKRYNAYCNAVEMSLPRMPYTEFMSALVRERDDVDTRSDILTIRDLSKLRLPNPDEAPAAGTSAPVPTPKQSIEPAPVKERVSRAERIVEAPAPAPKLESSPESSPVSEGQRFSIPVIICGLVTFVGMLLLLPALAGLPIAIAGVLAVICAVVVGYVFSLTGEVVQA